MELRPCISLYITRLPSVSVINSLPSVVSVCLGRYGLIHNIGMHIPNNYVN